MTLYHLYLCLCDWSPSEFFGTITWDRNSISHSIAQAELRLEILLLQAPRVMRPWAFTTVFSDLVFLNYMSTQSPFIFLRPFPCHLSHKFKQIFLLLFSSSPVSVLDETQLCLSPSKLTAVPAALLPHFTVPGFCHPSLFCCALTISLCCSSSQNELFLGSTRNSWISVVPVLILVPVLQQILRRYSLNQI